MPDHDYTRAPVNRLAAIVTSQAGCADGVMDNAQREERIRYLGRRLNELKRVLGIEKKSQHKNLRYKANKRKSFVANHVLREEIEEYFRLGDEMQRLMRYNNETKADQWIYARLRRSDVL